MTNTEIDKASTVIKALENNVLKLIDTIYEMVDFYDLENEQSTLDFCDELNERSVRY